MILSTDPMQAQDNIPVAAIKHIYRSGHRRRRVPLSCDSCRFRKLKCNREQPCQNCIARDERMNCKYQGSKNEITNLSPREHHTDPMRERMDHLENLVKNLIAQQSTDTSKQIKSVQNEDLLQHDTKTPTSHDAAHVAHVGTTIVDDSKSVYKGADDWYDVLREINDLKSVWNKTQDNASSDEIQSELPNLVDGASLLFGHVKQITRAEILATLPPKSAADKLVCEFFDYNAFPITVAPILHELTFKREYEEHWKDPSRTNIIWLGLLFSILSINMLSYYQFNEPPEYEGVSESLYQLYRLRTAQCLLIGDIAKCFPYTLETLRLNATAELNRKDDNSRGLWLMSGVIIRAAINMGYHRDPSHSPSISVLKAEFRRRVWSSVVAMDNLASFMVGFPRMMPAIYSDTKDPSNLHDWEILEESKILPPSRPLSDPTLATYLIVKGRLCSVLGLITNFNNTPTPGSYHEVLEIDKSLYDAYGAFPKHIKIPDGGNNFHSLDNKSHLTSFQLETMYHRGMCMLHRRYMSRARVDILYNFSRNRCISSALAILGYQRVLDPSLYNLTQTRQMLTLAAMILFLELELRRRYSDLAVVIGTGILLQALKTSCACWRNAEDSSDESRKVYQTLINMLSNFQGVDSSESSQKPTPESQMSFAEHNLQTQSVLDNPILEKDIFGITSDMDIDWATWDAFVGDASLDNGITYPS